MSGAVQLKRMAESDMTFALKSVGGTIEIRTVQSVGDCGMLILHEAALINAPEVPCILIVGGRQGCKVTSKHDTCTRL